MKFINLVFAISVAMYEIPDSIRFPEDLEISFMYPKGLLSEVEVTLYCATDAYLLCFGVCMCLCFIRIVGRSYKARCPVHFVE